VEAVSAVSGQSILAVEKALQEVELVSGRDHERLPVKDASQGAKC
jgi:hypothetical protein